MFQSHKVKKSSTIIDIRSSAYASMLEKSQNGADYMKAHGKEVFETVKMDGINLDAVLLRVMPPTEGAPGQKIRVYLLPFSKEVLSAANGNLEQPNTIMVNVNKPGSKSRENYIKKLPDDQTKTLFEKTQFIHPSKVTVNCNQGFWLSCEDRKALEKMEPGHFIKLINFTSRAGFPKSFDPAVPNQCPIFYSARSAIPDAGKPVAAFKQWLYEAAQTDVFERPVVKNEQSLPMLVPEAVNGLKLIRVVNPYDQENPNCMQVRQVLTVDKTTWQWEKDNGAQVGAKLGLRIQLTQQIGEDGQAELVALDTVLWPNIIQKSIPLLLEKKDSPSEHKELVARWAAFGPAIFHNLKYSLMCETDEKETSEERINLSGDDVYAYAFKLNAIMFSCNFPLFLKEYGVRVSASLVASELKVAAVPYHESEPRINDKVINLLDNKAVASRVLGYPNVVFVAFFNKNVPERAAPLIRAMDEDHGDDFVRVVLKKIGYKAKHKETQDAVDRFPSDDARTLFFAIQKTVWESCEKKMDKEEIAKVEHLFGLSGDEPAAVAASVVVVAPVTSTSSTAQPSMTTKATDEEKKQVQADLTKPLVLPPAVDAQEPPKKKTKQQQQQQH